MKTFSEKAYAKLNLYLGICGRREDGYHELETVFQSIDLCDLVSISVHRHGGISMRCNLPYLPCDGRNLAVKAANAFFQAAGMENPGLHINIKKVIPVGAGMAGGSTDAACVLQLLNRAFGMPLSEKALAQAALALGADVPFCLRGGTALAQGVGEKLTALPSMPTCWFVVGKPGFSVSTQRAFALYDALPERERPPVSHVQEALEQQDVRAVSAALFNALEEPVGQQHPAIPQIRQTLEQNGALGARMTGSGSAVYGIFDDREAAAAAAQAIRTLCRDVFLTEPQERSAFGKGGK